MSRSRRRGGWRRWHEGGADRGLRRLLLLGAAARRVRRRRPVRRTRSPIPGASRPGKARPSDAGHQSPVPPKRSPGDGRCGTAKGAGDIAAALPGASRQRRSKPARVRGAPDTARDIKNHTLAHLDFYLDAFEQRVEAAGGEVHWCPDGRRRTRRGAPNLPRRRTRSTVTKGKSMISEELGINEHLERNGIQPIETDLGEYIIQLRNETAKPHHRARLSSQPRGLGGAVPPVAYRPSGRPRVRANGATS